MTGNETKQRSSVEPRRTETMLVRPIVYHPSFGGRLDTWAGQCRCTEACLRKASEAAIRTRYHEATIHSPAIGQVPNVMALRLNLSRAAWVHYSVEPDAVLLRGFTWDMTPEERDRDDGGGFYGDYWEAAGGDGSERK